MNIQDFEPSSRGDLLETSLQSESLNSINHQKKNKITIYIILVIKYPTRMQEKYNLLCIVACQLFNSLSKTNLENSVIHRSLYDN